MLRRADQAENDLRQRIVHLIVRDVTSDYAHVAGEKIRIRVM